MGSPFLGEIRIASFGFAPNGWALCDGALMQINQNQALFSILGTTYGGNGITTFGLPNLGGRVPMHASIDHSVGESAGEESHTLVAAEMPVHTHVVHGSSAEGTAPAPAGNVLAGTRARLYNDPRSLTALAPSTIGSIGGSQPHENRQPFLVLTFMIAVQGTFPSQT